MQDQSGHVVVVKSKKPNTKGSSNRTGSKNAPKMLVYEALATLNRDFEQTLRDLNQLEELCIFPHRWQRKFVKTWRATLEETRAWASFEVLEVSTGLKNGNGSGSDASANVRRNNLNPMGSSHPPNQPSRRPAEAAKEG